MSNKYIHRVHQKIKGHTKSFDAHAVAQHEISAECDLCVRVLTLVMKETHRELTRFILANLWPAGGGEWIRDQGIFGSYVRGE